ncbi:hypothetical protein VPFG_00211 [Vibrio phage nt-1]|uniref:Uncharacterized protein n=1 Tax=Vibrio phage nt-1 TaxID=115992 RepID=R9TEM4_9CAUD|nr:hypothetical protein VPFG_00211 [Vibrio phage nt-1]AGN30211.1 hypothetical protein VPFG_00211 [Vibrio phage nt-1]
MKAFRINTKVVGLAILEGDIFVQSPFDESVFVIARVPSRPGTNIALINEFKHLYDEITVTKEEVPELIEYWKQQVDTNIQSLGLFRQSLLEQRRSIDDQIQQTELTIEKLKQIGE